ncbi:hypothetical protein BC826DRAFT_121447 [Russula brevipes]|nr:hypothetical protein BC826DRAFT_121447 [Russula brevipes]
MNMAAVEKTRRARKVQATVHPPDVALSGEVWPMAGQGHEPSKGISPPREYRSAEVEENSRILDGDLRAG